MPILNDGCATLRVADLSFMEKFALLGSWWRPGSECRGVADTRWQSWAEYFRDYAAVREELLARHSHPWPPFAEVGWAEFLAAPDLFDPDEASALYHDARRAQTRLALGPDGISDDHGGH